MKICSFLFVMAALEVVVWATASEHVASRVGNMQSASPADPSEHIPAVPEAFEATAKQPEKPANDLKECTKPSPHCTTPQTISQSTENKLMGSSQENSEADSDSSANKENVDSRWWSLVWMIVGALLLVAAGPGIKLTAEFGRKLNKAKTEERYDSIDHYDDLQDDSKTELKAREDSYATLVNAYYDLATEFYEWGWGTSFHFADKRKGESFATSILRHETYLAGRLGVNKDAKLLDCGCGVGGPARNIAAFTGAHVTGITINDFQVKRANTLNAQQGVSDRVNMVQGDFMKLPFEDNSFDGVYAIEATCHAPNREGVYSEILRVLKPGGVFATYEWCLTDEYDKENDEHNWIKKAIEVGDGLPDMCHTSVCTKAVIDSGFELVEARDCALDGHVEPWFRPLTPSWNPTKWPRFQFNPVMFFLMPRILAFFEFIKLVPAGTSKTQVMLQAGGIGCERGGATGIFTPMWLMVGRKPAA
jgi:sterol 24-C-methyltransferase